MPLRTAGRSKKTKQVWANKRTVTLPYPLAHNFGSVSPRQNGEASRDEPQNDHCRLLPDDEWRIRTSGEPRKLLKRGRPASGVWMRIA